MTADYPPSAQSLVPMGRIVGLYGVKGWVKVFSYTDPRQAILDYDRWWLEQDGNWRQVGLRDGKRHGKSVVASLDGCDDRDGAAELLEAEIAIPRSELPDPVTDSFYWTDLVGLSVETTEGRKLGTVSYLLETGAEDVLVVKGDVETLIPFAMHDTVRSVNLDDGLIVVDWEWD